MPPSRNEGPGSSSSSSRTRYPRQSQILETAPLLVAGPPAQTQNTGRHSDDTSSFDFESGQDQVEVFYHSSDESYCLDIIMEKVKSTELAHFIDNLAVESEPVSNFAIAF
jgi:hypothetical protein